MNSSSSGKGLEGFLSGKGFYIVLFLCAAVIGASAWMMAAGNETMREDALQTAAKSEDRRVETVILPARPGKEADFEPALEAEAPAVADEAPEDMTAPVDGVDSQTVEAAETVYTWPVGGELDRGHSGERLVFDPTMQDWRAHEGIDILAEPGTPVQAACAGTVESVRRDDMLGCVVTIRHADGCRSVYANLEDSPAVAEGDRVEGGQTIGAVGHTALAEVGQPSHLHFAMQADGHAVDPMEYLA